MGKVKRFLADFYFSVGSALAVLNRNVFLANFRCNSTDDSAELAFYGFKFGQTRMAQYECFISIIPIQAL